MERDLVRLLNSDAFIACLIPLILFLLGLQLHIKLYFFELRRLLSDILHGRRGTAGHFSVSRAIQSYEQYASLSKEELARMRVSYAKIGRTHKRIGYQLGYPSKLDRLEDAIKTNTKVARGIVNLARKQFGATLEDAAPGISSVQGDLGRVRESLKHFVRDWSEEGKEERSKIFAPILNVLKEIDPNTRASTRVLVPGSGLGRLSWEISRLGFDTTANELSFFMNLAFRFLLSGDTTQHAHQHVVQPYASWFSHQRTNNVLFREVTFPDVVPRLAEPVNLHLAECDFLSLRSPSAVRPQPGDIHGSPRYYDYIVTLFFLDTSLNVIQTIEHIHALLRPGGTWINLGPLLWTGGGQAALELGLDEVLSLIDKVGFRLRDDGGICKRRTIECEYTADTKAMMRWIYQAEFWVATKT